MYQLLLMNRNNYTHIA